MLSAMQFKKGLRQDKESYLAILKEHDDEKLTESVEVPTEV